MNTDERYARLQRSENARERNVAYEQIQRLNPRPQVTMFLPQTPTSKTLPELVSETVGPLYQRANGDAEASCPWHSSKSGRCLVIYCDGTRWLCRSCRRGGDAIAWLVLTRDMSIRAARNFLGLPPRPARRRQRPTLWARIP